jgi:hypothetical protein
MSHKVPLRSKPSAAQEQIAGSRVGRCEKGGLARDMCPFRCGPPVSSKCVVLPELVPRKTGARIMG